MLHYNPRHVSSSIMLMFRRTNCIIIASGIATLCKRPYSTPVESGTAFRSQPVYCTAVYREGRYTDAAIIQFVLLKMSIVLLETRRRL